MKNKRYSRIYEGIKKKFHILLTENIFSLISLNILRLCYNILKSNK